MSHVTITTHDILQIYHRICRHAKLWNLHNETWIARKGRNYDSMEALRSRGVSIVMLSKCEIYCKWKARVFTVTAVRKIRTYLKISIRDTRWAIEIKFTLGWFLVGGNCPKRQLEGLVRFITFNYDSLVESWSI